MPQTVYRFHVGDAVPLDEAEMSLQLAMIAVEGLYSPAAVRLDARYHVDRRQRAILVDGSTPVGAALVRVFTTLLVREFGDESFAVRRTPLADAVDPLPLTAVPFEASQGKVA